MKTSLALRTVLALALVSTAATAQVKIGVIASATGPTAVVGIPQKNTAALLPKKVGDLTVEYVVLDDASDPTKTVMDVKKLLAEEKIDALIGPSGSPNAVGVVPFMAESGTPMLAPVAGTLSPVKRSTRSSYRPPPATEPNETLRPASSTVSTVSTASKTGPV